MVAPDDLLKLNEFLLKEPRTQSVVPIKERSLEIFDDEKRLDALVSTSLFRAGRLDWMRDLKCEIIGEPLAWQRGPAAAASGQSLPSKTQPLGIPIVAGMWSANSSAPLSMAVTIVLWTGFIFCPTSFARWAARAAFFISATLTHAAWKIPQESSALAKNLGLPPVEPHLWSYRQLLKFGNDRSQPYDGEPASPTLCDWLGDCAEPARQLFTAGQRLVQEHVGWEFLQPLSLENSGEF